jgi:hypothetical protein
MLTKNAVVQSINGLPEEFTFDEVLDRLMLLEKVNRGIAQSDSDQTLSTAEAKERLSKWLR